MSKLYFFFCGCVLALLPALNAQTAYIPNNTGSGNIVSVVDLATYQVVNTIEVGTAPAGVAINESTQRAYITNELSGSVSVINTVDHSVVATIDVASTPYGITLAADGTKAYLVHIGADIATVINTITNTVIGTIPVGDSPRTITASPDGSKLYVANQGSDNISVIDPATDMVIMTIAAENAPNEVLVSADNTTLYVANFADDNVSVIDAASGVTTAVIPTSDTNPYNLALTADGNALYVTSSFGNNTVDVIDLTTNTVVNTITVGETPTGIEITPDNGRMVVSNFSSDDLSVIDIATNAVVATVPGINSAFGLGDFIFGEGIVLGAALDFDGVDDRVVLPSEGLLGDISDDFTISAWVNINDNTINQPIFSALNTDSDAVFALQANSTFTGNRPTFFVNTTNGTTIITTTSSLAINQWHHILVTYDSASELARLYINGVLEGNDFINDMPSLATMNEAYLGHQPAFQTFDGYFSGQMDEVRLTNTTSSCFGVEQQMNCELPADAAELVFYYQFNQGEGEGDNTAISTLAATAGPVGALENFALNGPNSNFVTVGGVVSGTTCEPVIVSEFSVTHLSSGTPIANGDNTPSMSDGTDIGTVPVMNPASSAFQLSGEEVELADITSSDSRFTFLLTDEDLLIVTFTPDAAGTVDTEISISTDDCSSDNSFTFTVQGTGIFLPGDLCEDAFDLNPLLGGPLFEPQVSSLYDNTEYTTDPSDPTFGYECFGEPDGNGGNPSLEHTVWYTFTGDGGFYNVTTIPCNATDYIDNGDTQIAIYSGDCATPVAEICAENFSTNDFAASIDFTAEEGVTYLMMIDGFGPDAPADGEYCVQITNVFDLNVVDLAATDLQLFPNPTNGMVQLPQLEFQQVEAYDATGRLVLTQRQPGTRLDLGTLPAGVYVLKLWSAEMVYSARVVKK